MAHTDDKLLDAAEAYEAEMERWGMRTNKTAGRYEVFRHSSDEVVSPVVVASATSHDTAKHECEEMSQIAAMKAALAILEK